MKRVNKRKPAIIAATCVALALLLCASFPALAEETTNTVYYIEPTLPAGVADYDENYPEDLVSDQLYAKSAILIEANSGTVVFEKNADAMMYPASTTKILTVFLGVVKGDLDATVTASSTAMDIPSGYSSIPMKVGETINFKDLLYATLLRSGNEGANMIAEAIAGSNDAFAEMMNAAAAAIGCTGTHFANPSGIDDVNNYTTARDMALIAQEAMKNDTFRDIAGTYMYNLPSSNLQGSRVLVGDSDNWMNNSEENTFYYPYAIGIKTGFLNRAGYCYVGAAEKEGVELISVVFYTTENGRWTDTEKLMEYGFTQFVSVTPMELYEMNPTEVQTTGYSMDDSNLGLLELGIQATSETRGVEIVTTQAEVESMARNLRENVLIEYTRENFAAPITAGETFGTLTYYPDDDGDPVVYNLYATRSIERRENAPKTIAEIQAETDADPNPFPSFSLELVFLLGWPFFLLLAVILILRRIFKKKSKHSRKRHIPKPKNRYFR